MSLSQWFNDQLKASADGFVWAVRQMPVERRSVQPPSPLGEWSAMRHLLHMVHHEQNVALPSMRQWLGGPLPSLTGLDEGANWQGSHDLDELVNQFQQTRSEQIALLPHFNPSTWEESRETLWGAATLRWVVTKTYQHTAEHTHNVLQLVLFWEAVVNVMQRE